MKSERRKFGIVLLFAVVFATLTFVSVGCASRTPPGEAWNRTFGGTDDDYAHSVQQTTDGGYIFAGSTSSYGAGYTVFWLVKTDSNGNRQWDKTFGKIGCDEAFFVQQTSDSGYIIAGSTGSYGAGSEDFWLVKTYPNGNEQWNKTFGGTDGDVAYCVQQTSDDGYIITGWTSSYGAGGSDFWLVKTDSNGNRQWDKTFGGGRAHSVQQTSDGGYIITGWTSSYGAGGSDFWLVKTDSNGNRQWDKTFGGTGYDCAHSVQQTSDGGYIIAGWTSSYGAGYTDFWLVKTDSNGNRQWDKTFGGTNNDVAQSAQQTSDGGYIIIGWTGGYTDDADFWLVKVGSTSLSETATPRSTPNSTPVQTPPPEQKYKNTQTIKFVGGIIFLAAAALLAGMLVGKFHKKDAKNQNAMKENTKPTKSPPEAPR